MKLLAHLSLLVLAWSVSLHAQDSVSTFAGQPLLTGTANGLGTNVLFNDPAGMAVDASGNLYVADSANHAIRRLATNGMAGTFAGQLGVAGTLDGSGTNAQFNTPSGLAFDHSGNLLVTDTGNATLRKISPAGNVTTLAGVAGESGYAEGAVGVALFGAPLGIAIATNGNIYVADGGNHVIRLLTGGTVSTFAGNPGVWGSTDGLGTNAQFNAPCGLAFDAGGNLFVSDANNHTIRKITPDGLVTTFAGSAGVAGSADGSTASATFCHPAEIVFDRRGDLLVADSFNHILREVSTNGMVSTVSGLAGISGDTDGVNGQGRFFNPYGLVFDPNGVLLVADTYNELIRQVLVPFKLTLQSTSTPPTVTLTWETVVGRQYQVQFTDNLTGSWTNLTELMTATGFTISQTDTPPRNQPQRHYRVLLWP
jgi:sugar lactone lactonase YvrE